MAIENLIKGGMNYSWSQFSRFDIIPIEEKVSLPQKQVYKKRLKEGEKDDGIGF